MAFVRSPGSVFRRRLALFSAGVALCVPHATTAAPAQDPDHISFNFQIRPLLSDRCFKCHGPDEKSRKAKLRLDTKDGAFAIRDAAKETRAIVPGAPESSEVYRRITATDPDDMMPPPKS